MGRVRFVIPNLVTLANVAVGFLAIPAASDGRFELAVWLLVAAVVLDMSDGQIARRLHATSEMGQQMDSLCDSLSFCVAPALLVYWAILQELGWIGLAVSVLYVIAGILRLARFNLLSDPHAKSDRTVGMPTPIGAGYLMAVALMRDELPPIVAALVVVAMAISMVSRVRLPEIKGRGPAACAIMVGAINFIVVVIWPNWYTVAWWNIWNVVILLSARIPSFKSLGRRRDRELLQS